MIFLSSQLFCLIQPRNSILLGDSYRAMITQFYLSYDKIYDANLKAMYVSCFPVICLCCLLLCP